MSRIYFLKKGILYIKGARKNFAKSTILLLKYALNIGPCKVMSLRILCTNVCFELDVSSLFSGCKGFLFEQIPQ